MVRDRVKDNSRSRKLMQTFQTRGRYVVHKRNLQLYFRHGMKSVEVHRIISFVEDHWMKQYVDFNTLMRRNASNKFEEDFFKLMNNAVFGKLMEDVRRHSNIKLVTDERRMRKLTAAPQFKRAVIFNQNLVGVDMLKSRVELNKPIYAGFTVLELSKITMYQFHYDVMKPQYGDRLHLLFTDTDSLCYEIETDCWEKDVANGLDKFMDLSNWPTTHSLHSNVNKKVLGKFKDEKGGFIISEFVGLRPKMYSLKMLDGAEEKRAKGIPKKNYKKIEA